MTVEKTTILSDQIVLGEHGVTMWNGEFASPAAAGEAGEAGQVLMLIPWHRVAILKDNGEKK